MKDLILKQLQEEVIDKVVEEIKKIPTEYPDHESDDFDKGNKNMKDKILSLLSKKPTPSKEEWLEEFDRKFKGFHKSGIKLMTIDYSDLAIEIKDFIRTLLVEQELKIREESYLKGWRDCQKLNK